MRTSGSHKPRLVGELAAMSALADALREATAPLEREDVERDVIRRLWRAGVQVQGIPWEGICRRAVIEGVLSVSHDGLWSAGPDVDDVPPSSLFRVGSEA